MSKKLFIFFIFGNLFFVFGQTDSILKILSTEKNPLKRAKLYETLSEIEPEDSKWQAYNRKALEISEEELKKDSSSLQKEFFLIKANSLNNLGLEYKMKGDFVSGMNYYYRGLELFEKLNDEKGQAACLNNISTIQFYLNDYDDALTNYLKARVFFKKYKAPELGSCLNNIGNIYSVKKENTKASLFFDSSIYVHRMNGDSVGLAFAMHNRALEFDIARQFTQAKKLIEEAILISKKINSGQTLCRHYCFLGKLFLKTKQEDSAIFYLKKAYEIALKVNNAEVLQEAADQLGLTLTDYKAANFYSREAFRLYKLLSNENIKKESFTKNLKHQFEKQQLEQQKENEKKEVANKIEKKRLQQVVWLIVFILIIITAFGFIVYSRYKFSQKQNQVILEQKHLVEEKQKEILDSIRYAKRIQNTLLASEKYIERTLNELRNKKK